MKIERKFTTEAGGAYGDLTPALGNFNRVVAEHDGAVWIADL